MKRIKILQIITISLFTSLNLNAQKVTLLEGSVKVLRGVKSVGLKFDYTNLRVGPDSIPEAEFLLQEKHKFNASYGEGFGDRWLSSWEEDGKLVCEPQFRILFNKYSKITPTNETAKYTIIYQPIQMYANYSFKNFMSAEVYIVETANPEHIYAKLLVAKKNKGVYYSSPIAVPEFKYFKYDYAKAGKKLGKFVKREVK